MLHWIQVDFDCRYVYFVKIRQFTYRQTNLMAMVINVCNQRKLETKRNWNTADFFQMTCHLKCQIGFLYKQRYTLTEKKACFFYREKLCVSTDVKNAFCWELMYGIYSTVRHSCIIYRTKYTYIEMGNTKYIGNGWKKFMQ